MLEILVFICLLLPFVFSFFTRFYSSSNQQFLSRIKYATLISFTLAALTISLSYYNISLNGAYSEIFIYLSFLIASLLYFLKVPTNRWKIAYDFVLIPSYLIVFLTLIIHSTPFEKKLNDDYVISAEVPGLLACGESISIRKNHLWMFLEKGPSERTCLHYVYDIQVIEFTSEKVVVDIYHGGSRSREKPHRMEIENDGFW
ncbi:MAG: hypothetical protein HWE14_07065 [Flavobacteriia bacterium]|nr:hypothetical protein [Flavobacteriia bacterium]